MSSIKGLILILIQGGASFHKMKQFDETIACCILIIFSSKFDVQLDFI